MEFDHIGLMTNEKKTDEVWVEDTRVWVTDPDNSPFRIEWLRFEPDTPVTGPLREQSHIAFRVPSIAEASKGMEELLAPFDPTDLVTVAFYKSADGAVIEFMEAIC
jgi:hypothetical protein